jgi:hypothetical protein
LQKLSPESRELVRNTKEEDLIHFHLSPWGMDIRKALGLWGQNVYLLRDLSPEQLIHADDASIDLDPSRLAAPSRVAARRVRELTG